MSVLYKNARNVRFVLFGKNSIVSQIVVVLVNIMLSDRSVHWSVCHKKCSEKHQRLYYAKTKTIHRQNIIPVSAEPGISAIQF